MFRTASQALAAATLVFAANTHAVVIDFENDGSGNPLSAGNVITTQYSSVGATFSTDQTKLGSSTPANLMIFDTANPTGGDGDLGTPGSGTNNSTALNNVLIISEDNDSNDPDDHANGGDIFIDFDVDVFFEDIGFLDIEEVNSTTVTLFDSIGAQIGSVFTVAGLGNNSFENVAIQTGGVRSATIHMSGSGAVTGLRYSVASVPEPSAVMLLSLGLFGMGALRRKAAARSH